MKWESVRATIFPPCATDPSGSGLRGFTITLRCSTFGRTPLDDLSARRRDLYLTTHNTTTDRYRCPDGIRTRSPSKREAANPRLTLEIAGFQLFGIRLQRALGFRKRLIQYVMEIETWDKAAGADGITSSSAEVKKMV